jgi:hypothetical protein
MAQVVELGYSMAQSLKQAGLPRLRWESGKVVHGIGHDTMLRLLERDPELIKRLHESRKVQKAEQEKYLRTYSHAGVGAGAAG